MQWSQCQKIANRATHTEKILLESRTYPRDLQTALVTKLGTSVGVKVTGTVLLSEFEVRPILRASRPGCVFRPSVPWSSSAAAALRLQGCAVTRPAPLAVLNKLISSTAASVWSWKLSQPNTPGLYFLWRATNINRADLIARTWISSTGSRFWFEGNLNM